jgi:hypothetical protein
VWQKARQTQRQDSLGYSALTAASVELTPYVVHGKLQLGQYRMKSWNTCIPAHCPPQIVYISCPVAFCIKYTDLDICCAVAQNYGIDVSLSQKEWLIDLSTRVHNDATLILSSFEQVKENIHHTPKTKTLFPPRAASRKLFMNIAKDFTDEFLPSNIKESGCAVCGQLTLVKTMISLQDVKDYLHVLIPTHTRQERISETDNICTMPGPVLAANCSTVCPECHSSLLAEKRPAL